MKTQKWLWLCMVALVAGCGTVDPNIDWPDSPLGPDNGFRADPWDGPVWGDGEALSVSTQTAMDQYGRAHPTCEWCGTQKIEVHHVLPQHLRPDLAADTNNMVSLCRECHFVVGHKKDWVHGYVPELRRMIGEYGGKP